MPKARTFPRPYDQGIPVPILLSLQRHITLARFVLTKYLARRPAFALQKYPKVIFAFTFLLNLHLLVMKTF
jgi:hypothetical protein